MPPTGFRGYPVFILFIALLLLAMPLRSHACPLGPRETRLELSRVMRNFGRLLLPSEQVSREGAQRPQSVTDQQLSAAIEGIRLAHSCAIAVLEAKTDELLPAKAGQLQGEERERYIVKYRSHMESFVAVLQEQRSLFENLLKTERERRDFGPLEAKRAQVRERANQAHGDL